MTDRHPDREVEKEADRVYRVRKRQPDDDAKIAAGKIAMAILMKIATGRTFKFQDLCDLITEQLKEFHVHQVRPQKG